MKDFLYSFYGKLSAVLLLLLLVLGAAQLYITYQSYQQFQSAADQQLNIDLAKNMAKELEPELRDTMAVDSIKSAIHYMMVFNPRIEIYVLDHEGEIMAYFSEQAEEVENTQIDMDPVMRFLEMPEQELILGDDPRNPGGQKPFSAAELKIGPSGHGYLYIILGSEQYESTLSMIQNSYILQTSLKIFGIILGLTAIAGLVLFALLTRRLRSMTDKVSEFEEGNLEVRLDDNSKDELGLLARCFNRMANKIQSNMEELKKTDKLRRNLIANVSHDLRSPLASMQGYIETILIKDSNLDKEERDRYLNTILKNTTMMRQLVDELFELSKLDAQQVEPDKELFSIAELVQDLLLKLQPRAEEKNIALVSDLDQKLPQVYADISHVERALTNIVENAIRYSSPGKEVIIDLEHKKAEIIVSIKDTGSGIKEEDLPHIFERFYRADKSRSKSDGSTGLGLAIANKIIELNDSEIRVESKEGVGTRFWFALPTKNHS